jgi:hypothetical protein
MIIYRVFKRSAPIVQIGEVTDTTWPMIKEGERIPLVIGNKDRLFKVTKVGHLNLDANDKFVIDLWVDEA